jgi:hypothetical protein
MLASYHIPDCLQRCHSLQRQETRWGKEFAVAELMRMAVLEEPDIPTVIALCRMLFVSKSAEPLRPPRLGEPCFLGDTTEECWPLQPIHLYQGVPFLVVKGWSVAGLPELATSYLAYSVLSGIWNEHPFMLIEQQDVVALTQEFIQHGPWRRPLDASEQSFLLSQAEPRQPANQSQ